MTKNERKAKRTKRKLRKERRLENDREYHRNKWYYTRGKGKSLVNIDSLTDGDEDNNGYDAIMSDGGKGADAIRNYEERTPEALAKVEAKAEAEKKRITADYLAKKHFVMCRLKEIGKGHLLGTFRGLCREFIETKIPNDSIENKRERIILCGAQKSKRRKLVRRIMKPQGANTTATLTNC